MRQKDEKDVLLYDCNPVSFQQHPSFEHCLFVYLTHKIQYIWSKNSAFKMAWRPMKCKLLGRFQNKTIELFMPPGYWNWRIFHDEAQLPPLRAPLHPSVILKRTHLIVSTAQREITIGDTDFYSLTLSNTKDHSSFVCMHTLAYDISSKYPGPCTFNPAFLPGIWPWQILYLGWIKCGYVMLLRSRF